MTQKIIKVGNSAALTLPVQFLQEAKLHVGDEIAVETNGPARMILIKHKSQEKVKSLTPEFFTWLNKISLKYEKTIKELAHR